MSGLKKEKVDRIYLEDVDYIVNGDIPLEELKDMSILVTGATGLLGSLLVKALLRCNQLRGSNITIIALVRSRDKVASIYGSLIEDKNLKFVFSDIRNLPEINDRIDYIIHGASLTSSKDFVEEPATTIDVAIQGSRNVLELAKKKNVKAFVYLSSLEVYGVTDDQKEEILEDDYGYIDILNVRSSYSESKKMVECMCISYAKQYNIPIKIARLCQTFGAGVQYEDNRVFAQFARCIIEKKNIILHTKGETVRNYCYTTDAIRAIIYILVKGQQGSAYNVANRDTVISIKDMAIMLTSHYAENHSKVVFELAPEEQYGYNPTVKINLNTDKLEKLGWKAEINLLDMFERTIESMECRKSSIQ